MRKSLERGQCSISSVSSKLSFVWFSSPFCVTYRVLYNKENIAQRLLIPYTGLTTCIKCVGTWRGGTLARELKGKERKTKREPVGFKNGKLCNTTQQTNLACVFPFSALRISSPLCPHVFVFSCFIVPRAVPSTWVPSSRAPTVSWTPLLDGHTFVTNITNFLSASTIAWRYICSPK